LAPLLALGDASVRLTTPGGFRLAPSGAALLVDFPFAFAFAIAFAGEGEPMLLEASWTWFVILCNS